MEEVVGSIPTRSTNSLRIILRTGVRYPTQTLRRYLKFEPSPRFLLSDFLGADFPIQQGRWRQANALLGLLVVSLVVVHAVNRTLGLRQCIFRVWVVRLRG